MNTIFPTIAGQDTKNVAIRQQRIAAIAAGTASGYLDVLRPELIRALNEGLTVNEINEVLIQMYAYCGFPRSLQGINTLMQVIAERKSEGIEDTKGPEPVMVSGGDKYVLGKETLEKLTGVRETEPSGANAFAPGIDVFLKEHLFADIFGRGVLSYSDREIATVSALTVLHGVDPMLRSHLNMALNTGLTEEELRASIETIRPLAGNDETDNALALLHSVISQRNDQK